MPAPVEYLLEPDANVTLPDVARRRAALGNRERTAAGLAPLVSDRPANAAAQRYATVMASAHAVVHDLEHTTGEQRLARAGRVLVVVAESTLEADNFGQAMERMLDDAAHRRQVGDRRVTHVGTRVVRDRRGELYTGIEYEQHPPTMDVAALEARAVEQLLTGRVTRRRAYRGNTIARGLRAPPASDADRSRIARSGGEPRARRVGRRGRGGAAPPLPGRRPTLRRAEAADGSRDRRRGRRRLATPRSRSDRRQHWRRAPRRCASGRRAGGPTSSSSRSYMGVR